MKIDGQNKNTKAQNLISIVILIACIGLSPYAQAVIPPPDGGYPGGNTAEGQTALFSLATGGFNTAIGWLSLRSNSTGSFNTAIGAGTLLANTADNNTATGAGALLGNTTGLQNTANGAFALFSNTEGVYNTAAGDAALFSNTSGESNTANGNGTLFYNTTGTANTAIGYGALSNNSTGSHNIALGSGAGGNLTTGSNNINIGNNGGLDGESATIRIGVSGVHTRTFIGAIREVTTGNGDAIPVMIDSAGQLGTTSSSRRFKHDIEPMDKASEAILALKPVTFHYKSDTRGTPQFGLIAEEVAEINPDLVVRDEKGALYTVRYDAVNAMLLNEFLKEHRKVKAQQSKIDKQEATMTEVRSIIAQQQEGMEVLAMRLEEQASQIQKISAQIGVSKPAPQTVVYNH
jgi:hypothetical protein